MRINRNTLLKIAGDTVTRRTKKDRKILCAYLCGSLLGEDYALGGTADIDLTFVHLEEVENEREIVRLTDEIHIDIAHYPEREFHQTRELRIHPWLGPTIFECQPLYDPQHFLDFTQASVRGQFHNPEYVLDRSRRQVESARQIWMAFYNETPAEPGPQELLDYLRATGQAANAVASLNGPPLTERRFALAFLERAEAVARPGLYPGLMGLLGAPHVQVDQLRAWMPAWVSTFTDLPEDGLPPRLHPHRCVYYASAFEALLDGDQPLGVLWPLLRTWTLAVSVLPAGSPQGETWREACQQLQLLGENFTERVEALDAYLDMVEETLEAWGHVRGVPV